MVVVLPVELHPTLQDHLYHPLRSFKYNMWLCVVLTGLLLIVARRTPMLIRQPLRTTLLAFGAKACSYFSFIVKTSSSLSSCQRRKYGGTGVDRCSSSSPPLRSWVWHSCTKATCSSLSWDRLITLNRSRSRRCWTHSKRAHCDHTFSTATIKSCYGRKHSPRRRSCKGSQAKNVLICFSQLGAPWRNFQDKRAEFFSWQLGERLPAALRRHIRCGVLLVRWI